MLRLGIRLHTNYISLFFYYKDIPLHLKKSLAHSTFLNLLSPSLPSKIMSTIPQRYTMIWIILSILLPTALSAKVTIEPGSRSTDPSLYLCTSAPLQGQRPQDVNITSWSFPGQCIQTSNYDECHDIRDDDYGVYSGMFQKPMGKGRTEWFQPKMVLLDYGLECEFWNRWSCNGEQLPAVDAPGEDFSSRTTQESPRSFKCSISPLYAGKPPYPIRR